MASIYFPYTKKEAMGIVRRYYGVTINQAKDILERAVWYSVGCPYPDYPGRFVTHVENLLLEREENKRKALKERYNL